MKTKETESQGVFPAVRRAGEWRAGIHRLPAICV
jgi:hypothetical protein